MKKRGQDGRATSPRHKNPYSPQILPYLEEGNTYKNIDFSAGVYAPKNAAVRAIKISLFECPSYPGMQNPAAGLSNYAGCHNDVEAPIDENNNGVLFLNSHIRNKDITDGAANTIFVGEKSGGEEDLGWMSGTRATLRNTGAALAHTMLYESDNRASTQLAQAAAAETISEPEQSADASQKPAAEKEKPAKEQEKPDTKDQPAEEPAKPAQDQAATDLYVGGFGSFHPYGVNFLFGDGAVHFISNDIDLKLLEQLGNRADGKLLTGGPTRGE